MNVVYEFTEKFYEEQVIIRLNKFLVKALVDGREVNCHLHDPGRLKELIYLGDIKRY